MTGEVKLTPDEVAKFNKQAGERQAANQDKWSQDALKAGRVDEAISRAERADALREAAAKGKTIK
jgi:hypothetical protein